MNQTPIYLPLQLNQKSGMKFNFNYQESFENRHIGPNETDKDKMLTAIGVASLDELIKETIPATIRMKVPMNLPAAKSEFDYINDLKVLASHNRVFKSYIGQGYYNTITPPVIQRNILENPGWYTQYTPYQAEIAQGRLTALLNFQTMVMDFTGMEVANASLLDEATAAAEAMAMLFSMRKNTEAHTFFVSDGVFKQTIDVLETRSNPLGIKLLIGNSASLPTDGSVFGAIIQYPNANGSIENIQSFIENAHKSDCLVVVATDLLSLALLTPPGELGADVVVGTTQRFGVPMGFGGPHAAFFATRDEYKRSLPGRIIGVSVDVAGNPALRMALQTREQHIRRDKATSNICTAQALLAIMASMYAVYHGPKGIKNIASRTHAIAELLNKHLKDLGYSQLNENFFDTLCINAGDLKDAIHKDALDNEINFAYRENLILISVDETTNVKDVKLIVSIFAKMKGKSVSEIDFDSVNEINFESISESNLRKSAYLSHPVFNTHHSEHEMLRYIKSLENKDLSLTHSMIALGSCTMKLNATTEMLPVTWAEFGALHPFAPIDQVGGYIQLFDELSTALCEITGFDAMSLQPNAGAQGEYAGLMVIRAYLNDIGQGSRNVVLIPSSAHGTNPASAVMAGFKVVVTKCDELGNINMDDLRKHATEHKDDLAGLMVTYPSTHGVFEEAIIEICQLIHDFGGQVYMDGANMNAQVGLTSPALIGADVCHLNLHKTFCIPHGGGGPGMGPIGVKSHLAPFLPGHVFAKTGGEKAMPAISAAPWGSASILVISHAYIAMMGAEGLANATRFAILNANYIKHRLENDFPILYTGTNGRAAHEMILDCRSFKSFGIEVADIAKRLMDYGFHAPTVSFPVAGTLMIEPTESEGLAELDRFCDAMLSIRKEIEDVETGIYDKINNPLKNAPHTAEVITANEWDKSYTRQKAAYPLLFVKNNKFWPSVGRINETQGDRVFICSCPPVESYAEVEI